MIHQHDRRTQQKVKTWCYLGYLALNEFYFTSWVQEEHTIEIEDLQGKEDSVTLDTTGFQFAKKAAKHKSFTNDEDIKKEYYPESIELIQELTGASKVVLFDHSRSPFSLVSVTRLIVFYLIAVRRNRPGDKEDTPEKRR